MNATETPESDAAELEANIGVTSFDPSDLVEAYDFARSLERRLTAMTRERDELAIQKHVLTQLGENLCEQVTAMTAERDKARAQLQAARLFIERMAMPNTTEWLLTTAMQEGRGVLARIGDMEKEGAK